MFRALLLQYIVHYNTVLSQTIGHKTLQIFTLGIVQRIYVYTQTNYVESWIIKRCLLKDKILNISNMTTCIYTS